MSARGVARAVVLWPPIARPGYWFATLCAFLWGCLLLGHFQYHRLPQGGIHYFTGLPRWAFGRGGTTVGAIFLTGPRVRNEGVFAHEAVHKQQWRRYGLTMIPLYIAAGSNALTNRFEIEAGLELGGYVRRGSARREVG